MQSASIYTCDAKRRTCDELMFCNGAWIAEGVLGEGERSIYTQIGIGTFITLVGIFVRGGAPLVSVVDFPS